MLEKLKNAIRYERKINVNSEKIWNLLNDGHSFVVTNSKFGIGFFWRVFWRIILPFLTNLFVSILVTSWVISIFGIGELPVSGVAERVMTLLGLILFLVAIVASYIIVALFPFIRDFTYDKPKIISHLILFVTNALLTFVLLSINYGVFSIIY